MSEIQIMGTAAFAKWEKIDEWCNRWTKKYFGNHTSATAERDGESFNISIVGLEKRDKEAFSTLFAKYDQDHDYDADSEFCEGDSPALLPDCITLAVMNQFAKEFGIKTVGHVVATYFGVYFMENSLEHFS